MNENPTFPYRIMDSHSKELFDFINKECLLYSINIREDGKVSVKWEKLEPTDYVLSFPVVNKINLRIQRTRDKVYFIDFFQHRREEQEVSWVGFHMSSCSHYRVVADAQTSLFDVVFYFDNDQNIKVRSVNTETVFVLQNFFTGFL